MLTKLRPNKSSKLAEAPDSQHPASKGQINKRMKTRGAKHKGNQDGGNTKTEIKCISESSAGAKEEGLCQYS